MATRMIVKNGDPQLRKHCHEVKDFNPRLHTLLDDMRQTLAESNGVGLAAPHKSADFRFVTGIHLLFRPFQAFFQPVDHAVLLKHIHSFHTCAGVRPRVSR